jgi:hypothetical protein
MEEFKNKNDYSFTIFFVGGGKLVLDYVHNCYKSLQWVETIKKTPVQSILVTVRRSGRRLFTWKPPEYMPPYPK